jgi:hypothetical protein
MSDLTGYIGPNVESGTYVYGGPLDFSYTESLADNVDTLRTELLAAGWTQPTIDGIPAGTLASSELTVFNFIYHPSNWAINAIPGVTDAAILGNYYGLNFVMYDPFVDEPDPTGPGVVGVALSSSPFGTLQNFMAKANANTPWTWAFKTGPGLGSDGGFTEAEGANGPGYLIITANTTGPDYSVNGAQSFSFSTNGLYETGEGPYGGGWTLISAGAPTTGDQITVTIYLDSAGGTQVLFQMPGATPSVSTGPPTWDGAAFKLAPSLLTYSLNPYQAAFNWLPGNAPDTFGGASGNVIAAALNVPSVFGPATQDISSVTATADLPVVVETAAPHGCTMQDRVKISGAAGTTLINGAWWVAKIPSPTTLWLSSAALAFLFGDGNSYTGGGTVYDVETSTSYSITNVRNDTSDPVLITTSVAHGLNPGDFTQLSSVGGIAHLSGTYSVAAVPSPTTLEIATLDAGILEGDGSSYGGSAVLTTGIFQAMFASASLTQPDSGTFYDNGLDTYVATQGVTGSVAPVERLQINGATQSPTEAQYAVTIQAPWHGVTAADLATTAAKPVAVAPYVAIRLGNQEARLAGTLWDSYVQMQSISFGTPASYNDTRFTAALPYSGQQNATLFLRTQNT